MIILKTKGLKYTYPDGTIAVQDLNIGSVAKNSEKYVNL